MYEARRKKGGAIAIEHGGVDAVVCGYLTCPGLLARIIKLYVGDGWQEAIDIPAIFSKYSGGLHFALPVAQKRRFQRGDRVVRHAPGLTIRNQEDELDASRDIIHRDDLPITIDCPRCGRTSRVARDLIDSTTHHA